MILIVVFVLVVFLYSLVSRRLEHTVVTAPIVFTSAGILLILAMPGFQELDMQRESLPKLAEMGLVMLLFTDATHIILKELIHGC
jgi:predicted Kef-type K+ transport protein